MSELSPTHSKAIKLARTRLGWRLRGEPIEKQRETDLPRLARQCSVDYAVLLRVFTSGGTPEEVAKIEWAIETRLPNDFHAAGGVLNPKITQYGNDATGRHNCHAGCADGFVHHDLCVALNALAQKELKAAVAFSEAERQVALAALKHAERRAQIRDGRNDDEQWEERIAQHRAVAEQLRSALPRIAAHLDAIVALGTARLFPAKKAANKATALEMCDRAVAQYGKVAAISQAGAAR